MCLKKHFIHRVQARERYDEEDTIRIQQARKVVRCCFQNCRIKLSLKITHTKKKKHSAIIDGILSL